MTVSVNKTTGVKGRLIEHVIYYVIYSITLIESVRNEFDNAIGEVGVAINKNMN